MSSVSGSVGADTISVTSRVEPSESVAVTTMPVLSKVSPVVYFVFWGIVVTSIFSMLLPKAIRKAESFLK